MTARKNLVGIFSLLAVLFLSLSTGSMALVNDGKILAHYNFTDGVDSSGNGRTLTDGGVSYATTSYGNISTGATNFSSTRLLSRTTEPWMFCMETGSGCTINFWFNSTTNIDGTILGHATGGDHNGQGFLTVDSSNKLHYYEFHSGYTSLTSTASITLNQYYMGTLVFNTDGTTLLYLNGVNTNNQTYNVESPTGDPLTVGYIGNQGPFNGTINDITFANETWNQAQINTLYNGGVGLAWPLDANVTPPPPSPPTVVSGSIALTSDNQTLIISGRGDATAASSITYLYTIINNGVNVTTLTSPSRPANVSVNYANYSLSSTPGNYSVLFRVNDGLANSTGTNTSNTVSATFPAVPAPAVMTYSLSLLASEIALLIFIAFIGGILVAAGDNEQIRQGYVVLLTILLVAIILTIFTLL